MFRRYDEGTDQLFWSLALVLGSAIILIFF